MPKQCTILLGIAILLSSGGQLLAQANGLLDLKPFGAKADGVTDDTSAFTDALNALSAGGGEIRLAPGTYLITRTIAPSKRLHMSCNGAIHPNAGGSCRILKASKVNGPAIFFGGSTQGSVLEGIAVDGQPGNIGDGIQILANSIALRDVSVLNQGGNGVYIGEEQTRNGTQANSFFLERVRSVGNQGAGFVVKKKDITGPNWPDANAGTFINCVAQSNKGDGLVIDMSTDNTFIGTLSEGNGGAGLHLIAGTGAHVFIGGDFNEGNKGGNVLIDPGNVRPSIFIGVDTGSSVADNGNIKSYFLGSLSHMPGGVALPPGGAGLSVGSAQVLSGKGAPSGGCNPGSLYLRSDSGWGPTLFVCEHGRWASK